MAVSHEVYVLLLLEHCVLALGSSELVEKVFRTVCIVFENL